MFINLRKALDRRCISLREYADFLGISEAAVQDKLEGGKGTMKGAILGAFIMSVLTNGLRLLSFSTEWQKVLTGVIIIIAVYIDIVGKRKKNG